LEEADAVASLSSARVVGTLKINVPVSFGLLHLAPLWGRFMAAHPHVQLDVTLSDRTVDLIEEGVDVAVRIAQLPSTNLIARKLAPARLVTCAAPAYLERHGVPQTPADLAGHHILGYAYWSARNEWSFHDASGSLHKVTVQHAFVANNGDTLRATALSGAGIILQPTFIVGEDIAAGRLVPLLTDYTSAELGIYALYPSRKHLSAKVRALVDFLVQAFEGTPVWDRFDLPPLQNPK
ncbi:MAG: substrate binding domain-containing protein, partial [Gammaproteobacteria bacterium]